jgi:hypothetical protein
VRSERACAAHEDGREFWNVVAVRPFLDVLQIVEAEAHDFAGMRNRHRIFQPAQGPARGGGSALGERREITIVVTEDRSKVARQLGLRDVEVDHLIALDHTQMRARVCLEPDYFHRVIPLVLLEKAGTLTGSKDGSKPVRWAGLPYAHACMNAWTSVCWRATGWWLMMARHPTQESHRYVGADPRADPRKQDVHPAVRVADHREGGQQIDHATPVRG